MFKLAVFTDEVSQDPKEVVALAKEFKLDGVEIRSIWDTPPQKLTGAQISELQALFLENGLKVCAIASPFLKSNLGDDAGYQEQFEILRRCISLGKAMGTKFIRGFTCWKTADKPEVWAELERVYRQVIPVLEAEDAIIVIENEADTSACTAALTAKFLQRMNHPRLRAVWDPANEVYAEGGEKPYPDAYQKLKPFLAHVHVKDALRDPDGKPRCVRISEGAVNWKAQLQGLHDDGYTGWLSLETHWRPVDLTDALIKRPGGQAYSESAAEASRFCLLSLAEIFPYQR